MGILWNRRGIGAGVGAKADLILFQSQSRLINFSGAGADYNLTGSATLIISFKMQLVFR